MNARLILPATSNIDLAIAASVPLILGLEEAFED